MFIEATLRNWPELSSRYVLTGTGVVLLLMILTSLDVAGATWIWESGHWLAASGVAFALAVYGWRRADGVERRVRGAISMSIGLWLAGVVAWIIQSAAGSQAIPAVSDAIFVAAVVPAAIGFHIGLRARDDGQMWFVYLDAFLFFAALATLLFSVFAPSDPEAGPQLLLTIPVAFLALAGAGLIASLEGGVAANNPGLAFLLAGCALLGTAYLIWIAEAPAVPAPGAIGNYICSIGILAGGIGAAILRLPTSGRVPGLRTRAILDLVPALAVGWTLAILVGRELTGAAGDLLVMVAAFSVIAVSALRQAWLVRQRGVLIARERELTDAAVRSLERLTDAEERYRSLIERIPAVIYLDEADPARPGRSRLVFVSPQVERMLGIRPEELVRDPELWYELIHPDDREGVMAAEMGHFADGNPLVREFRMHRRDGSLVWVRDEALLVPGNGNGRRSHGVVLDVTAEKTFEEALRTSEEQVRSIIETASSAFVGMDGAGVITDWNARAEETFGWRREEAIGKRVGELIVPEASRLQHEAGFRRVQRGGRTRSRGRRELAAMHRDGREFPVEIAMWAIEQGGSYRFSALIEDITERKRLEEELRRQAFEDSLTGLANRALFIDRVGHALRRQRDGKRSAVLVADLDDFSLVNEAMGHAAGDDLLIQVAGRLSAALRPGDTVARMGGDEFAILLEEVESGLAERVAERILNGLRSPFAVGGRRITIQATIGLAYSTGAEESEAILRLADAAMHAAKRAGKGQVLRYSEEHRGAGVQDLELRAEFRHALEQDQLELVYQPILDLATRRTVGLEALLRWDHPSRGLLTPDRFLHLADNAELSGRLAGWVLREAARQARVLIVAGRPLWISVNLSPRQLGHPDLVGAVRGAIDAARIDPRLMVLEITEHGVMQDIDATADALGRLKEVGIRIAIDDFGTGYSSLSYLAQLPLDILKIDRSFITAIGRSEQDRALVQAVADLAASLGLQVIAEGIEEVDQLGHLHSMRIDLGQGYLMSRPLTPEALAAWLDS